MDKKNNRVRFIVIFAVAFIIAYALSVGVKDWYATKQVRQGLLEQEQTEKAYRDDLNLAFFPMFQNIHESTLVSLQESDKSVINSIIKDTREKLLALTVPEKFKDVHLRAVIFLSEFETALLGADIGVYPALFEKMGVLQDEIQGLTAN